MNLDKLEEKIVTHFEEDEWCRILLVEKCEILSHLRVLGAIFYHQKPKGILKDYHLNGHYNYAFWDDGKCTLIFDK